MLDSEVVAAIVAGEPDGLAEAYDRYASPLYTYCRSLLHEPADAADAVQDTFVIAASKLAGLRDQSRLRPWLYAVARNECHRRLRENARGATSALDLLPEMSDESADVTGGAERAELRALLRSAVRGLNTGEQDLIELQLRQELDVEEIAAVLGVSRNHAHALLSRARDQLEISLGALLVARSGRADCAALSALLEDWDGQLNVLMRKRINRHIERCPACTERKRRELAPALLLGLAPLAALPMAAMPHGLRAEVLRLASSDTPEAVAHRASVAQQAATFGPSGFPKPLDPPKPPWWRARRTQSVAAGAAVVAVAAVVAGWRLAAAWRPTTADRTPWGRFREAVPGPCPRLPPGLRPAPLPAVRTSRRGPRCRRAASPGCRQAPGRAARPRRDRAARRRRGRAARRRPARRLVRTRRVALAKRAIVQPEQLAWFARAVHEHRYADQQALLPSATACGRDTERQSHDDPAQPAHGREPHPDRVGRPRDMVHHGAVEPDRQGARLAFFRHAGVRAERHSDLLGQQPGLGGQPVHREPGRYRGHRRAGRRNRLVN